MRRVTLLLLAALGACNSSAEIVPSPIPPGVHLGSGQSTEESSLETADDLGGARLDEVLAVAEGEPLSLRELVRRLGLSPEEAADPDSQDEIAKETREWVKDRLFMKAAERAGLKLPAARVDEILNEQLDKALELASKKLDQPISREEYLDSKGVTYAEWRVRSEGALLRDVYMYKLTDGLGRGSRPMVDMAVAPSEIRRLYKEHSKIFDLESELRMAQFEVDFDRFEEADPEGEFMEWERQAGAMATTLRADFKSGIAPAQLAAKYELGEDGEHWRAMPEGQFSSTSGDPKVKAWMLAPERRVGDTMQVAVPSGLMVFGVIERREARRVPFSEATLVVTERLKNVRREYLRSKLLLEFLSAGDVVWPRSMADEIAEEAYTKLEDISKDPVWAGARLK